MKLRVGDTVSIPGSHWRTVSFDGKRYIAGCGEKLTAAEVKRRHRDWRGSNPFGGCGGPCWVCKQFYIAEQLIADGSIP